MAKTYKEFKEDIELGIPMQDYYEQIVLHSSSILLDVGLNNQKIVANQLGISHAKFSSIFNIIKAIVSLGLVEEEYHAINQ
jgi:hypothetical protein